METIKSNYNFKWYGNNISYSNSRKWKYVSKVIDELMKIGAEVIYSSLEDVHVSGHACQEEQKLIITLAKPKFFIPVHGEYRQLIAHAETAKN